MNIKFLRFKKIVFLFSAVLIATLILSCASAPKEKTVGGRASSTFQGNPEEKTAISTENVNDKKNKNYTYFSMIDESIMTDVEIGSPASLRKAASALRRLDFSSGTGESIKVLLSVESSIMQMVWQTERVDWESPALSFETPYTGAINSAKNGIYDMSTGNVDFLTIVLPSLVVLKVNDVSPFFEDSERALQKALTIRENSVLAQYLLGTLYRKNGQPDKALTMFRAAASNSTDCMQTMYSYTLAMYEAGMINESYNQAAALSVKYPANPLILKLCARISYNMKNYDAAEEYVARVLQQDPNDLESVLFRARILIQKKDYIHAASLLDVYSRQDSSSKEYLMLRAQIQYDWSKNVTAAVTTIETAIRNYPEDLEVMLFAAKLSGAGNVTISGKSAEDYANAVLAKEPGNEAALRYAVEGFILKKNWQKAYGLSASLILKDDSLENIFNHVKICLSLKNYDEAWNLVSPLYRNRASDEDVLQWYVRVMVESGRTQQAASLVNQLLNGASSKLKSFLYYERSFLQSTEENSLSDLRSSLIANPRNSDSLFRLYQIYYGKLDYRKAQYYLKQVVALNPTDLEIRRLNEELTSLIK